MEGILFWQRTVLLHIAGSFTVKRYVNRIVLSLIWACFWHVAPTGQYLARRRMVNSYFPGRQHRLIFVPRNKYGTSSDVSCTRHYYSTNGTYPRGGACSSGRDLKRCSSGDGDKLMASSAICLAVYWPVQLPVQAHFYWIDSFLLYIFICVFNHLRVSLISIGPVIFRCQRTFLHDVALLLLSVRLKDWQVRSISKTLCYNTSNLWLNCSF